MDNLNLVDAMDAVRRILDRPISEQVIEVPKFIIDDIPTRTLVPEPQMAERLVAQGPQRAQTRTKIPSAAWLVLSGASAGGFALSFVFLQWFLPRW